MALENYVQLDQTYYLEIISADSMGYDSFEYTVTVGAVSHVCDFEEVGAKAPTCLIAGNIAYRVCVECGKKVNLDGEEIDLVAIAATGHITENVQPTVLVAPTCTERGKQVIRCAAEGCDAEMYSEIPAMGHRISSDWSVDVESTCTEAGKQSHHCLNENCDYFEDQREMPPVDHDYQITVVLQATCLTSGVNIKICRDCGYREEETVQATGQHVFGEWMTSRESTCTAKGEKKQICSVCGTENVLELDQLLHSYSTDWMIDTEPTCVSVGIRSYHCALCDHQKDIEEIAALGHNLSDQYIFDQQPTCEEIGQKSKHCLRCDYKTDIIEIAPLSHDFGEWILVSSATCVSIGAERRTCSNCGKNENREIATAFGHDFGVEFVVDIPAACENEGRESKHCSRCEAVSEDRAIPAIGHSFGAWRIFSAATCTNKEKRERACITCQKAEIEELGEPLGHWFETTYTVDVAATCETDGSTSRHCSRCDVQTDVTAIASIGHAYDSGVVAVEPTAEIAGSTVFTCGNCGKTYFELIEKLPPMMLNVETQIVWSSTSKESVCFRSAAALSDFVEVRINGNVVPEGCYTLSEGSTVVELKREYLKTLEIGTYTLEIVSTTGVASAEFVVENHEAERNFVLIAGVFLALMIVGGLMLIIVWRNKDKRTAVAVGDGVMPQAKSSTVSAENSEQDTTNGAV